MTARASLQEMATLEPAVEAPVAGARLRLVGAAPSRPWTGAG